MKIVFHADDYGITCEQSQRILDLSAARGGALESISIFANSPVFEQAADLAAPCANDGTLAIGLHFNVVEGFPCSDPKQIPLLVDERGAFAHDFGSLLKLSFGPKRADLQHQLDLECQSQIRRFLAAFPQFQRTLRIDSHQHVHAIPAIFDAMLAAIQSSNCSPAQLRMPAESVPCHFRANGLRNLRAVNVVKALVLRTLSCANWSKVPNGCATPAFCGVVLSGCMDRLDERTLHALARDASARGNDLEVLFHPVSVPQNECLDPCNRAFANACASPARDAEALWLQRHRA